MANNNQLNSGESDLNIPSCFQILLRNLNNLDALINVQNNYSEFYPTPEPFFYSCIVTLATYWEVFCTDLIKEATFTLSHELDNYTTLPVELRRIVTKELKNDKHEFSAWKLAQNNWRGYVYSRVQNLDNNPNDLKSARPKNIEAAIVKFLGFKDFETLWVVKDKSKVEIKGSISEFLDKRNDIVHKGILLNTKIGDSEYLVSQKDFFTQLAHSFLKYFDRKLFETIGIRFYEYEVILESKKWPFNYLKEIGV